VTKTKTVVLGVTGSIASYKACDIVSRLKREDIDVQVIMTREAKELVTPLTFQTLSGNRVVTDMFDVPDEWDPVHVSLAQKASLILIAPATANVIAKLAAGLCDDMLTCTVLASKAPVLLAPAMNDNMYSKKIVQENIDKLKKYGYKFIGPIKGRLACGCEGLGHIADVKDIVTEAKRLMK
jgi:phosphopantothenoylcysteine decarboxylase/phosphopantothenate--cysteine ligase